ncbi:nuclear pore complex-interacting protein family member A1, partial [Daubentonia madagascariensis]
SQAAENKRTSGGRKAEEAARGQEKLEVGCRRNRDVQ